MPAASSPPAMDHARLHTRLIKASSTDRTLHNNHVTLYSLSPSTLPSALRLFRCLPFTSTAASWTALISAHSNDPAAALRLLVSMLRRPKIPSQATLSALLKALSSSLPSFLSSGLQIHALAHKIALPRLSFAGSALVHFYCKARRPRDALNAFEEISDQDEVCYGALVVGLAQNHCAADALSVFATMRSVSAVSSTMYSVSGALRAAAHLAALEQSRIIHAHAVVAGLEINLVVSTALVDAYGKSGIASDAWKVFEGMVTDANLVMWNAMLGAYAQQGDSERATQLFNEMLRQDFWPDEYTFLALLTACSNAGLADESERWIALMTSRYGVVPGLEHYTCLVGVMARVGRLGDAERLALTMPCEPDAAVWRTLLSGSIVHRAVDMATVAGRRLLELDHRDDSAYVMLANIYSSTGKKSETAKVWTEMRDHGVKKEGGRSWIEVRGEVHVFIAGDRKHERMAEIYAKLRELMEAVGKLGYKEMDVELWYHSERLAVAFGVVSGSVPKGKSLRVVKNLRICSDCHEFFKYVSRVIDRGIVHFQISSDFHDFSRDRTMMLKDLIDDDLRSMAQDRRTIEPLQSMTRKSSISSIKFFMLKLRPSRKDLNVPASYYDSEGNPEGSSPGLGPRFRVRVGASIARIPRPRHRDDAVVEGQGGGEAVPAPRRNPLVPFPASRGFRCRSAGAAGDAA
ncbi:hypothetical protein BHM03_00017784 [Ensete ventricosum]|nr:hypothetical protein BHM03_00017784 [Ensete ventricosum]